MKKIALSLENSGYGKKESQNAAWLCDGNLALANDLLSS